MDKFLRIMGIIFLTTIVFFVILYFVYIKVKIFSIENKIKKIIRWSNNITHAVNSNTKVMEKFLGIERM